MLRGGEGQQESTSVEGDVDGQTPESEETLDKAPETAGDEAVQEDNAQDAGANMLSETAGEEQTSGSSTSASSDVNKPVIEGFELVQQGQTLHEGDTVEVHVDAYDADSGIREVEVYLSEDYETGSEGRWFDMEYSEELDCYVGTITLDHVGTGKIHIQTVRVIDNNSNYTNYSVYEEDGYTYKYWFNTANDVNTIEPLSIDFPAAGELVTAEDYGKFALTLPEEKPGHYSVRISFEGKNGNTDYEYLGWDSDEERYQDYGLYMTSGDYTVSSVTIERLGEDMQVVLDDEYSFTYQRDETEVPVDDTEAPVITSVSIDKNEQIVRAGDVVNVTIKAEDNVGLNEYAYAYFRATSDIVDDSEYVSLTYSEEQQAYVGTFEITEDTYPCEWYLSSLDISDTSNNEAQYWQQLSGYPYYVQVYSGNTFVNPVYEVSYQLYELSADGEWTDAGVVEGTAERRQTLSEAGIEFPQIEAKYADFVFQGWTSGDGTPITGDEEIVSSQYYSAYAMYDQVKCDIVYRYYTADGDTGRIYESVNLPQGSTYGELKAEAFTKEVPEQYPGMNFTGWKWASGYEDDQIINPTSYSVADAVYDKSPARVSYGYVDGSGSWQRVEEIFLLEKGATYKDLRTSVAEYMPEDMTSEYTFAQWETGGREVPDTDDVIDEATIDSYTYNAKYEGKNVILLEEQYYNETGAGQSYDGIYFPLVIDEGADAQDAKDAYDKLELPAMYEGLRFKSWDWGYFGEGTVIRNAMTVVVSATYENCMIRYLLDPICVDLDNQTEPLYDYAAEALFCQVAEVGDTITIPGSFEGYDDVTYWGDIQAGDSYTVESSITFYGYTPEMAAGTPEDPEEPGTTPEEPGTTPEEPGTTPEEPGTTPGTPEEPATELPESSVNSIVNMVQNTAEGGTINVDMGAATVVPKEVLEAAQGRDVTIELRMDGYTWTINGKDIAAGSLTDINLAVTLNSNAIPSSTVQKLAGDNPTMQLSLAHNGDFGFRASLTINVGSEHAGKFGNLYYYDSDGRMVFMNAGSVNADGSVSLSFSHASDYVVVISDQEMSQADVPADLQPVNGSGNNSQSTGSGSVQTGDASPIIPTLIVLVLAAAVIAGVAAGKKRCK